MSSDKLIEMACNRAMEQLDILNIFVQNLVIAILESSNFFDLLRMQHVFLLKYRFVIVVWFLETKSNLFHHISPWNHLNSQRANFFFYFFSYIFFHIYRAYHVISRMHRFSVSGRKLILSKFALIEDVNLQGRATLEYHKN